MRLANIPETEEDIVRQDGEDAPVVKHTKNKGQGGKTKKNKHQENAYHLAHES